MAKRGRPRTKISRTQYFRTEWKKLFEFYHRSISEHTLKDKMRETESSDTMGKMDIYYKGFQHGVEYGELISTTAFHLFVEDALHTLSISKTAKTYVKMLNSDDNRVTKFAEKQPY